MAEIDTTVYAFVHGDTVNIPITWTGPETGSPPNAPVNLTGATIRADIKKEYTGEVLTSFNIIETDFATGKFTLNLPASLSALLPQNPKGRIMSFVFDVDIQYAGSPITKETMMTGYLKVTNEVTV